VRFLFVGDVVGTPGVNFVAKVLPGLRVSEALDFVVVNGENATNGSGLTPRDYRKLRQSGADAVTLGDHIYKKFEIAEVLNTPTEPIVKPANYPAVSPGRDYCTLTVNGVRVVVISLMGRTYMRAVDCPFAAVDRVLASAPPGSVIVVDVHAEATADKYQLLHHLQGRVTAILGTHTHVATADEHVRNGTAYITDAGMTGPHESILGRRADRVLATAVSFEPTSFDVATGDVRLNGVIVECDAVTGRATAIRRVCVRET